MRIPSDGLREPEFVDADLPPAAAECLAGQPQTSVRSVGMDEVGMVVLVLGLVLVLVSGFKTGFRISRLSRVRLVIRFRI